jgi:hypothetical protein
VGGTLYTTTYSTSFGNNLTIIFGGYSEESCTLSTVVNGSLLQILSPSPYTIPGTYPETNVLITQPGADWPPGTYTLTATCSLAHYPDATATQVVTITP